MGRNIMLWLLIVLGNVVLYLWMWVCWYILFPIAVVHRVHDHDFFLLLVQHFQSGVVFVCQFCYIYLPDSVYSLLTLEYLWSSIYLEINQGPLKTWKRLWKIVPQKLGETGGFVSEISEPHIEQQACVAGLFQYQQLQPPQPQEHQQKASSGAGGARWSLALDGI